jgi:hypothetical protein
MSRVELPSVAVSSWEKWDEVSQVWASVADACSSTSFFLSADWVAAWIEVFGPVLRPEIAVFYSADTPIGCCVLVTRTELVRFLPLRRVYLNCAGEDEQDSTCIEHNTLLVIPGCELAVNGLLLKLLRGRRWDQFLAEGVCGARDLLTWPSTSSLSTIRPDYYVDLQKIRATGAPYENSLSGNTRSQIRRALKLYEERCSSPVRVAEMPSKEEALAALQRLAGLHQAAWTSRGKPGVFQSPLFTDFHRKLIARTFPAGGVQLLCISAGPQDVGLLYNFVFRGRVYFYQSGFQYADDNRLKPGLVSHFLAIQHCLSRPHLLEYDFLAGESQYKRSLSTSVRDMYWLCCDRPTARTVILRGLRRAKRVYSSFRPSKPE